MPGRRSDIRRAPAAIRDRRTETTINDTYDVGVGRTLKNMPALIAVGRSLNRRLLAAECESARCRHAVTAVDRVLQPTVSGGQRVSALHFGNPRARALEAALCQFAVGALAPEGFRACDLRTAMPELCGAAAYSAAQASYDLRRLCRKGFLERIPHTHRYRLTAWGRGPRWTRQVTGPRPTARVRASDEGRDTDAPPCTGDARGAHARQAHPSRRRSMINAQRRLSDCGP